MSRVQTRQGKVRGILSPKRIEERLGASAEVPSDIDIESLRRRIMIRIPHMPLADVPRRVAGAAAYASVKRIPCRVQKEYP